MHNKCFTFFFCNAFISNNILFVSMSELFFSTDQSAIIILYKTECTTRVVFRLVNIFTCLAHNWTVKDKSKSTTPNEMLWDVIVSLLMNYLRSSLLLFSPWIHMFGDDDHAPWVSYQYRQFILSNNSITTIIFGIDICLVNQTYKELICPTIWITLPKRLC